MPGSRARALSLLAALALAATGAAGCDAYTESFSDESTTEVAVDTIRFTGRSGDIAVQPGAGGAVTVRRTVRYSEDPPEGEFHRVSGTTLFLNTECGRHCAISYLVIAPPGVTVSGQAGSGDIRLADTAAVSVTVDSGNISVNRAAGPLRLRTGSGDIDVTDVNAGVNARASSGDIEATGVRGDADLETGSGNVELALLDPANVRGHTNSGDITLTVPNDGYRVLTDVGSGDVDLGGIVHDPGGAHQFDLETGSGNITVRAAAAR